MNKQHITLYFQQDILPFGVNESRFLTEFQTKFDLDIDASFLSQTRLFEIFQHKSFYHENATSVSHNEKLEFLGDAVLDTIVAHDLIQKYPEKSEGELSKFRSAIVNEDSLFEIAQKLDLGKLILMGRGEFKERGFEKPSLLSDCFEALIGGVFIDHGYKRTLDFFHDVLNYLQSHYNYDLYAETLLLQFDAKTKLQEAVMHDFKVAPTYEIKELIDNKKRSYEISFKINEQVVATIFDHSKKKGMQKLARKILNENLINKNMENLC